MKEGGRGVVGGVFGWGCTLLTINTVGELIGCYSTNIQNDANRKNQT